MQITRNSLETAAGPGDWFTGEVYIDTIATATAPSRLAAASVHFPPGARTAWHTHPFGQTIHVTEGLGLCQRRGGPIEEIRPGDTVYFEPDEDHWHGATPDRFMTHIAMQEVDASGSPVTWGHHVTEEEYGAPRTQPRSTALHAKQGLLSSRGGVPALDEPRLSGPAPGGRSLRLAKRERRRSSGVGSGRPGVHPIAA